MSRRVSIGVVAILLVLLAIVSQAVNPIRWPQQKKPAMPREQRERMMQEMQSKMKQQEKNQIANTLAHERKVEKEHPYKDTMTNDWYRERSAGSAGLRDLDKQSPKPKN